MTVSLKHMLLISEEWHHTEHQFFFLTFPKCSQQITLGTRCSSRDVRKKQKTSFSMDPNPVYEVYRHPQSMSLREQQQQQQQESEFDMNHNPLYMLHTRPQQEINPSAVHEYETVEPLARTSGPSTDM